MKVYFAIPSQERIDAGERPEISVSALDLLVEDETNGTDGTMGYFDVDALSVFMEEANDEESAETVALWLESMAADVRAKFAQPK